MSERKKNPARSFDGAPERIEKLEGLLEDLSRRLGALESQLAGAVGLEQGSAVDLDAWEKKWEEKYALLSARQKELESPESRVQRAPELLEDPRKDFPAAGMPPARSWKQAVGARMSELEGLAGRRPTQNKASRWVSFFVDLGKKH
ncbi:MAG TPA: hypothetical protein VGA73_13200 [Candidatus Binatia bacterium]